MTMKEKKTSAKPTSSPEVIQVSLVDESGSKKVKTTNEVKKGESEAKTAAKDQLPRYHIWPGS